jgi:hypothetical protein
MKAVLCLAAVVGALATANTIAATPIGGNCPTSESGFIVWDVSTQPYQVDNAVDVNGNDNGQVCAKRVDSLTFVSGGQTYPVYNFIDDVIR